MKSNGRPPIVRLTVPRLVARVQKLRASLDGAAVLRKVAELRSGLQPAERARAAEELERLRGVLGEVAKARRSKR